jgi:hypothetical protein
MSREEIPARDQRPPENPRSPRWRRCGSTPPARHRPHRRDRAALIVTDSRPGHFPPGRDKAPGAASHRGAAGRNARTELEATA